MRLQSPQIDRSAVRLFRRVAGFVIGLDGLTKLAGVPWLYGSAAYVAIPDWIFNSPNPLNWPVLYFNEAGWIALLLFQIFCGVALSVSRWPRAALLLALIVMRICLRRNGLAGHVGDLGFIFMCYWVLILPGEYFLKKAEQLTPNPRAWPLVLQAGSMFFFAGLYKLQNESWRLGQFFVRYAQYPEAEIALAPIKESFLILKALSYGLPYMQIFFGLGLVLFFNFKKARLLILLFMIFFHLAGLWLSKDLIMFLLLTAPLCLLLPLSLNQQSEARPTLDRKKHRDAALSMVAATLILSSNIVFMVGYRPGLITQYKSFLSAIQMYQGWRVFDGAVTEKFVTSYKVKYADKTEAQPPLSSKKNFLIQNRYNSIRSSSKSDEGHKNWLRGLCTDEKMAGRDPASIETTIERLILSDDPPLQVEKTTISRTVVFCSHNNSAQTENPHE